MHQTASSATLASSSFRLQPPAAAANPLLIESLLAPRAAGFDIWLSQASSSRTTPGAANPEPPPPTAEPAASQPVSDSQSGEETDEPQAEELPGELQLGVVAPSIPHTDSPLATPASQTATEPGSQENAVHNGKNAAAHEAAVVLNEDEPVSATASVISPDPSDPQPAAQDAPVELATDGAKQAAADVPQPTIKPAAEGGGEPEMDDRPSTGSNARKSRAARVSSSGRHASSHSASAEAVRGERVPQAAAAETPAATSAEPILGTDPANLTPLTESPIQALTANTPDTPAAESPTANTTGSVNLPTGVLAAGDTSAATTSPASAASLSSGSHPSRGPNAAATAETSAGVGAGQQSRLVERVLRGIEQLQGGATQVRVRLHPPQLGSLQMSLRIEQSQMQLELVVESAAARDAVRNRMQELEGRLAEQGLELQRVEIKVAGQQTSGSGHDMHHGAAQHGSDSPPHGSGQPQSQPRHGDGQQHSSDPAPPIRALSETPATSIDIRA
jgi:flagellar hook-length control protein FliK